MTRSQIEDDYWALADAYRAASVARAKAEGRLALRPKDLKLSRLRFDAGMAEANALTLLLNRTRELADIAGHGVEAEIRQAAIVQATNAGLLALKATLREGASDAA